jgi:hypothetical protein
MTTRLVLSAVACLTILAPAAAARAGEEKVPLDRVPPAVVKAVKAKFPNASLKQAEKEVEGGKTIYEIGLEDAGSRVDVSLQEDGTVLEVEKEVRASALPKPVSDAVKRKYPAGTVKKAEEVTKGDTETFEVVVAVGDKRREVVVDPAGKIVEDEETDED